MEKNIPLLFLLGSFSVVLFLHTDVVSGQPKTLHRTIHYKEDSIDKLAQTPPMGWNSWNHFHRNINERLIMEVADSMVTSGLKEVGYQYIILDDGWEDSKRDSNGNLQADSGRFPCGMKYLADYLHKKRLKLGIYSSAGTKTCQGLPGSIDHEEADAKMFAKWDVDYLKYDNCNDHLGRSAAERFTVMRKALESVNRPIIYSISASGGGRRPWEWAPEVGNLWRTTEDIQDNWNVVMNILDEQIGLNKYAGPGHWNDPDMLEVGNGRMSDTEYKGHFSLWCMLAAPLVAGNDLRNMSSETIKILTNREVIAIDQDPAGNEGYKLEDQGDQEVWIKPLMHGDWAILLLNRGEKTVFMTLKIKNISIKKSNAYILRDLWEHKQDRITDGLVRADVVAHGVKMYRVSVVN